MAHMSQIFSLFKSIPDTSVDQALSAALPTADDQTAMTLVQTLIQRNHHSSLTGLFHHYHELALPVQKLIISHAPRFGMLLRQIAEHGRAQDQLNIVQIVKKAADPKLCYLLADVLRYGPSQANEDAASILWEMARYSLFQTDDSQTIQVDHEYINLLQRTIDQALMFYGMHQQPAVLEAVLVMQPRPMIQTAKILNDPKNPATQILIKLCSQPRNPVLCQSLLSLLSVPVLTEAIQRGVGFMADNHTLHQLFTEGHLLLMPQRRKVFRQLGADEKFFPDVQTLQGIQPQQLRHLPRWYATITNNDKQLIEHLGDLRKSTDSLTRLTALRMLMRLGLKDSQAVNLIAGFCADADEWVARNAMRHLVRVDYEDLYHLMLRLINSPHDSVRKIAAEHVGPVGFEKYWDSWSRFDLNQRIAAGKALIKIDPSFHVQLGRKLDSTDQVQMHKAMFIIRTLNQGTFFEYALEHLTRHEDPKIASAAVKTLGSAGTLRAARLLETSLDHDDPRMRANAVEALDHIDHKKHVNQLMNMGKEDDNRPRANAIGALMSMNFGDALTMLGNMLNDDRPTHRISALWLVDHLNLRDMIRHVAELSISDNDSKVRTRASHLIDHFINSYAEDELQDDMASDLTDTSGEKSS